MTSVSAVSVNTVTSSNEPKKKNILKPTLVNAGIGAGTGVGVNYAVQKSILKWPNFFTKLLANRAEDGSITIKNKSLDDVIKSGKFSKIFMAKTALKFAASFAIITALVKFLKSDK